MTELNRKIQKYIERSQVTVYQIAKYTGLDRTMIQKMIKGSKYPGVQFFQKFCDALLMNREERAELLRLFQIEKVGAARFETRDAVRDLIGIMLRIPEQFQLNHESPISSVSFQKSAVPAEEIVGRQKLTICTYRMVHEQISKKDNAHIYIDMFGQMELLLLEIYRARQQSGHSVQVHQHLMVSWQGSAEGNNVENIRRLRTVLPMIFLMADDYQITYSYFNNTVDEYQYTPFRHYLLTEEQLLLMNAVFTIIGLWIIAKPRKQ